MITGGSSGLGLATARRFVADGAYVFITGRRDSELNAAVKQIGKNVISVQGDVSNLSDLDKLYATVKQQKGRIDILFANAGLWEFVRLEEITEAHFDKLFNINVKGLLFTVQKALPLFQNGGSHGFHRRIQRSRGIGCLSCDQGCYTVVRTFVDRRPQTSQNPGQRYQSWPNRHSWLKTRFAEHARCREINDDVLERHTSREIWQS